MAELADGQFEIDGVTFGGATDAVKVGDLDMGTRTLTVQDAQIGWRGDVAFGRDVDDAPEWLFQLFVHAASGRTMLDAKATFRLAWDGPKATPGALSTLRYNIGGQTWRVYGRPRRFADLSLVHGLHFGRAASMMASFKLSSSLVLSDAISTVSGSGSAVVAGYSPTPATVTLTGPATDPKVSCAAWEAGIAGTLATGASVTIDGRTTTALTNTGASAAGTLTAGTRMSQMMLPVGSTALTHAGGGTAATTWRNARLTF